MSHLGPSGPIDDFFEQRLRLLGVLMIAVFAVFLLRLVQLQMVEGEEHRLRSQRNSIRTERLTAPRGEILDREGRVLATTRPAFHLEVVPSELREPDRTLTVLAALLAEDRNEVRALYGEPRGRSRFQPLRLAADLDWEQLARVEAHRYALPGVLTEVRPQRTYPNGPLAAHLLGTLGEVRDKQLESERFEDYRAGDVVGQSGVEALLERHLRGYAGGRNVVVDVAGREVEVLDRIEPRPGSRAVLTLDLDLQRAAEDALAASGPPGEPVSGAVVALDPRSGDVLVLASLPAFDPNAFAGRIERATWRGLTEDPLRPLHNRALAGQYPPGSTYKAIVASAALEEKVRTPRTSIFCPGAFAFGNRSYRCWKAGGHGTVDLHRSLMQSCDVYYYRAGLDLGIDRLADYAKAFGLGAPTGIGLDGEQAGLVPTSAWKERRFGEPWLPGETVSAAIGQGYNLTTPLQLAVAYAAVANGGDVLRPRLVLELETPDRGTTQPPPERIRHVPVSAENLALVREGLHAVVDAPGGTGRRAHVEGLAVGGKTGTAQVVRLEKTQGKKGLAIPRPHRDHAWFASFAPVDAPEIVVSVLVEHGGGGGANAAPVAQKVLQRWWDKKRGVPGAPAPEVHAAAGAARDLVAATPSGAPHEEEGPDAAD
jgi:penicillin-binding protein 2